MALQMFLDERKSMLALKSSSSSSSPRPLPPPFAYALAMRALTGVHQHKVRVASVVEAEVGCQREAELRFCRPWNAILSRMRSRSACAHPPAGSSCVVDGGGVAGLLVVPPTIRNQLRRERIWKQKKELVMF